MRYDIQEYNKQTVTSEQKMLLYNLGRLNQGLPPHFMMLSSVSQQRTFQGSSGFNWANPATWSLPFSATTSESPTIQFVPIQGQDFANRFESSLTDKFTMFLEDREWYATAAEKKEIVLLFVQSLMLLHGDNDACPKGNGLNLYLNRLRERGGIQPVENHYYDAFSNCVTEIVDSYNDYELIDGSRQIQTIDSIAPVGADLVSALGAGYKWTGGNGTYHLTNAIKIPAWFDYNPNFVAPAEPAPDPGEPVPPVFPLGAHPHWTLLTYFHTPANYAARSYRVSTTGNETVNVLVPDGYRLARQQNGELQTDANGNYVAERQRSTTHLAAGRTTGGSLYIEDVRGLDVHDVGRRITGAGIADAATIASINAKTNTVRISAVARTSSRTEFTVISHASRIARPSGRTTRGSFDLADVRGIGEGDIGSDIAGYGIPNSAKIVAFRPLDRTATISLPALNNSRTALTIGAADQLQDRFSYSDEVAGLVWPVPQNYFYFELRKNNTRTPGFAITDNIAERDCFSDPSADPNDGVVCGYFKIGNLLQIMQKLSDMACLGDEAYEGHCGEEKNFGIGINVPSWAETSASFADRDGLNEYVWVPAHNPERQPELADRDRRAFFVLYKLYQMSLVNTSQLVSGAPSITLPSGGGSSTSGH